MVGGPPEHGRRLTRTLGARGHRCTRVDDARDARTAAGSGRYEVVLVHRDLPDGDGLELVAWLRNHTPVSKPIVFSDRETLATTMAAVRTGAVDVITEVKDVDCFVERIEQALARTVFEQHREEKLRRLEHVSQDLQKSRDEINGQVGSLCDEMVQAYQDMTSQLDEVAMAAEFRTLIRMELDIEEALRTALEYLLTRTGPTNAAVFLPDLDGRYSLGAYVNYDCPRSDIEPTLARIAEDTCPRLGSAPAIMNFIDPEEFVEYTGIDDPVLRASDVAAFSCRHEGECLAVVILFRADTDPFPPSLLGRLDILRGIFAEHLARIVDVHHRAKPSWPGGEEEHWSDFDDEPDWGFCGIAA